MFYRHLRHGNIKNQKESELLGVFFKNVFGKKAAASRQPLSKPYFLGCGNMMTRVNYRLSDLIEPKIESR